MHWARVALPDRLLEAPLKYTLTGLAAALLVATFQMAAPSVAGAQGAHMGDGDVPVRSECATGSEGVLEAARMMIETPEMFFEGGSLHDRPGPLRATISQRGNIALIVDDDNDIIPRGVNWNDGREVGEVNAAMISAFYRVFADEYDFLFFFTERNLDIGAYYSPLMNDITGIGYQHSMPRETFEFFGERRVQGIILMNNYRGYLGPQGIDVGRLTFNQEIGHRWGSRVHAVIAGRDSNEVLGRDLSHWSYFMHSANSSMEGNTWLDRGGREFVTRTRIDQFSYSNLDRYLMGLLLPEEADDEDLYIIRDPLTGAQRDLTGNRINRSSPPQMFGGDKLVSGQRYDLSVADIVAAEGPRTPDAIESRKVWRAAFILIMRPAHGLRDADFDDFDEMRRRMADDFMEAAGHEMVLQTFLGDRVGLGAVCRFGLDCDPDLGGRCKAPAEGEDKLCLPACDVPTGCPPTWCCGSDIGFDEELCLPESYCPEPPGEEGEEALNVPPHDCDAEGGGQEDCGSEGEGEVEAEGEGEREEEGAVVGVEGAGEGAGPGSGGDVDPTADPEPAGQSAGGGTGGGGGGSVGCASVQSPFRGLILGVRR